MVDRGEGRVREVLEAPHSLVLSFFGEDIDYYGTKMLYWGMGGYSW